MQIVVVAVGSENPEQVIRRELDFPDGASVYAGTPEVFEGFEGTNPLRGAIVVRHLGGPPLFGHFTNRTNGEIKPRPPLHALASDLLACEVAKALPYLIGYERLDRLKSALETCGELAMSRRIKVAIFSCPKCGHVVNESIEFLNQLRTCEQCGELMLYREVVSES